MKLNFNSRTNVISTLGILDLIDSKIDQPVLTTADVSFNDITSETNILCKNDLVVEGNLTVSGSTTVISTEIVEIKDNIVLINAGNSSSNLSGIEIDRENQVNFQTVFDETDSSYKLGLAGDLQKVATREDTPLNKGILVFNELEERLDSVNSVEIPITFSANEESSNSSNGSLKVVGGIGVTGNIFTDKNIHFLGSSNTYTSNIASNTSDDIIITAGNDINLNCTTVKANSIDFGTSNITSNVDEDLLLTSNIIKLQETSFLRWGSNFNDFTFDGTDLTIRSTGKFKIEADSEFGSTRISSSSTVGSIVFNGGVSISLDENAISSSSGGSFTTAGGLSVNKKVFVGETVVLGDTSIDINLGENIGLNLRSIAREYTNTGNSTNNISFNSFDGGIISGASSITDASTLFVKGSPTGNAVNSYSVLVESGTSKFSGDILSDSNLIIGNKGNLSVLQGSNQGTNFRSKVRSIVTNSTINTAFNSFEGGQIISGNTFTQASTLVINSAPFITGGGSISNPYSLLIDSGTSRFKGKIISSETSLDSVTLDGGIFVKNVSESSVRSLGGINIVGSLSSDSFLKTKNSGIASTAGNIHLKFNNDSDISRFSFGLKGIEGSGNVGSDLVLSNYDNSGTIISDIFTVKRSNSTVNFDNTVNFNSTVNNISILNLLGTTTVNTNVSPFNVVGSEGLSFNLSGNSVIDTDTGSMNIGSSGGSLILNSLSGTNISSSSSVVINSSSNTSINNASGNLNVNNQNFNVVSTNQVSISSNIDTIISSVGNTNLSGAIGNLVFDTINLTSLETVVSGNFTVGGDFAVLGTATTIDSTLITINDNAIVVNAAPSGISDGGVLFRRYQTSNDLGQGQVVNGPVKESGLIGTGSNSTTTVILSNSSSGVDNFYKGWWIKLASGESRRIKSYTAATKEAEIYSSIDTTDYDDGLDFNSAPITGDSYELFDSPYSGIYFSESSQEIVVSGVAFDVGTGQFGTPTSYLPLHAKSLIIEDSFATNGDITGGVITGTSVDTEALSIGDIFVVDTINSILTFRKQVGDSILNFNHDNFNSDDTVFSSIRSTVDNNIGGELKSSLIFSVQNGSNLLKLNGSSVSVDITGKLNVSGTITVKTGDGEPNVNDKIIFSGSSKAGNNLDGVWLSSPTATSFYTGVNKTVSIGNNINLIGSSGISFASGGIISEVSNVVVLSGSSFILNGRSEFKESGELRLNGVACIINDSDDSISFNIAGNNVLDDTTIENGTRNKVIISRLGQSTVNSSNSGVSVELAASSYIKGSVISGSNTVLNSSNGLYIDSVSSINTDVSKTIDSANSLFIKNSPFGENITNARSILVEAGTSEFKGDTILSGDIFASKIGSGNPLVGSRGLGTKLILNDDTVGGDASLGITDSNMWVSSPDSLSFFVGGSSVKLRITPIGTILSEPSISCESNTSSLVLEGGIKGSGRGKVTLNENVSIDSGAGQILMESGAVFNNVIDSSSSNSSSSIKCLGGVSVAKSVSIGNELNLDFSQLYTISGSVLGELQFESKELNFDSTINHFTNAGTSNVSQYYGLGNKGSVVNTEYLGIGMYSNVYTLKTGSSGTGTNKDLNIQVGSNTGQILLKDDSTVKFSSSVDSSSSVSGAVIVDGGVGIAKKLFVGGEFSAGVNNALVSVVAGNSLVCRRSNVFVNSGIRFFSAVFQVEPPSGGNEITFEFTLPEILTNFVNVYDCAITVSGFNSTFINIENTIGYAIIGTTSATVKFTSVDTSVHTIQVNANY